LVRHAETIRYWRILLNKPKIGARRKPDILQFERMLPFDAIPTLHTLPAISTISRENASGIKA
jgi:hypothetical protein